MYIVILGWRAGELWNNSNYRVAALTLSDRKSSLSLCDAGYKTRNLFDQRCQNYRQKIFLHVILVNKMNIIL